MITADFVATINKLRLTNKDGWYQFIGTVNGKDVEIKGYKTWLQVFLVDGLRLNTISDISVKNFKDELTRGVT